VGGIIVYVLTNDSGGNSHSASAPVTVIVGTQDIPAGSLAKDLLAKNALREEQVAPGQLVAGAVQSLNQLQGATFISGFAKGQQITTAGLQLVNRRYKLPTGYEAVAVNLPFVDGDAGYVNVGDQINLYGVIGQTQNIRGATLPRAQLLLSDVRVLDVSQAIAANGAQAADGTVRATSASVTYLLALKTSDVEKVVFAQKFESLYASLTDGTSPAAGPTAGVGGDNILQLAPNANPTAG
jgi:Flp pilus assembly protein CpaB